MSTTIESLSSELQAICNGQTTELTRLQIVLVDDEQELLGMVSEILQPLGLGVHTFTSPVDATEFITKNFKTVVFILSDFKMPTMTGLGFRKLIPAAAQDIPFVILSGHVTREMAIEGIDCKVFKFLEKPLNEEALTDVLMAEALPRVRGLIEEREILVGFLSDADSILEQIEVSLLSLEEGADPTEVINSVFGMVHTIKGSSGFFEPKRLHQFAHHFEEMLKKLQAGTLDLTEARVSSLLAGMDIVKSLVAELKTDTYGATTIEELLQSLETSSTSNETVVHSLSEGSKAKKTDTPKEKDVKVALHVLDHFLQASGEMTVIRNMINKTVQSIQRSYPNDPNIHRLEEFLEELHKINSHVQHKVTDLRKVSVKNTLKSVPRLVRDLSKKLEKDVQLLFTGEDLRIDTSIAEIVGQGIVHLIRNSMDHGIEGPAERERQGKTSPATLRINSFQKDDRVLVEIHDDGRGIDPERIRSKLLKLGHHTPEQVRSMSIPDLQNMIFAPGFSTAEAISDVSGRGVGLSSVLESVRAMGGKVTVQSEVGKGATVCLELPVPKSVLIKNSLFIDIAGYDFAVPQENVLQVVRINSDDSTDNKLMNIGGSPILRYQDQLIPVVNLAEKLHLTPQPSDSLGVQNEKELLLVQNSKNRTLALYVDAVRDFEDAVIKQVDLSLRPLKIYAGATFLSDRKLGLILDVDAICQMWIAPVDQPAPAKRQKTRTKSTDFERAYLVFQSSGPEYYSIPQEALFRIEEMEMTSSDRVRKYRDGLLHLVDLPCSSTPTKDNLASSLKTVLVVKEKDHFFGFPVTSIVDFVSTAKDPEVLPFPVPAITGTLILGGNSTSLLNPALVIAEWAGRKNLAVPKSA